MRGHGREVIRDAMRSMAQLWKADMAPRHFRADASARYGYKQRSRKYLARKQQLFKRGLIPSPRLALVYTGLTRAKATGMASIRAYPTRATVDLYTPSYVRIRPMGNRPNLYNEITAIAADERPILDRHLAAEADRGFRAIQSKYTVTIQA